MSTEIGARHSQVFIHLFSLVCQTHNPVAFMPQASECSVSVGPIRQRSSRQIRSANQPSKSCETAVKRPEGQHENRPGETRGTHPLTKAPAPRRIRYLALVQTLPLGESSFAVPCSLFPISCFLLTVHCSLSSASQSAPSAQPQTAAKAHSSSGPHPPPRPAPHRASTHSSSSHRRSKHPSHSAQP